MCILYSEMGKHQQALEHAKASCKVNYNLVYDLLVVMYGCWNKREKIGERKRQGYDSWRQGYEGRNDDEEMDIENSIAVLLHLLAVTKDLKLAFLQKDKAVLLDEQMQMAKKLGK